MLRNQIQDVRHHIPVRSLLDTSSTVKQIKFSIVSLIIGNCDLPFQPTQKDPLNRNRSIACNPVHPQIWPPLTPAIRTIGGSLIGLAAAKHENPASFDSPLAGRAVCIRRKTHIRSGNRLQLPCIGKRVSSCRLKPGRFAAQYGDGVLAGIRDTAAMAEVCAAGDMGRRQHVWMPSKPGILWRGFRVKYVDSRRNLAGFNPVPQRLLFNHCHPRHQDKQSSLGQGINNIAADNLQRCRHWRQTDYEIFQMTAPTQPESLPA